MLLRKIRDQKILSMAQVIVHFENNIVFET